MLRPVARRDEDPNYCFGPLVIYLLGPSSWSFTMRDERDIERIRQIVTD